MPGCAARGTSTPSQISVFALPASISAAGLIPVPSQSSLIQTTYDLHGVWDSTNPVEEQVAHLETAVLRLTDLSLPAAAPLSRRTQI